MKPKSVVPVKAVLGVGPKVSQSHVKILNLREKPQSGTKKPVSMQTQLLQLISPLITTVAVWIL